LGRLAVRRLWRALLLNRHRAGEPTRRSALVRSASERSQRRAQEAEVPKWQVATRRLTLERF